MKQYSVLSVDGNVADEFGLVKGNFAKQDGTILYHTVRWFTPTGTFSSSGTSVTTTGSQLTASMVGAKIGVGTDKRIITAFLTSNTCTVDSAFSQNYVSQPLANWGVYSKTYENSAGTQIFYATDGANRTQLGTNGVMSVSSMTQRFSRGVFGDGVLSGHNGYIINFSSTTVSDGTKDLGIRRNSAGVLEIFDGVTNGALRDLRLRNIIPTLTTYATDAAADADSALPSGGFYKLTGLRTVFQKP